MNLHYVYMLESAHAFKSARTNSKYVYMCMQGYVTQVIYTYVNKYEDLYVAITPSPPPTSTVAFNKPAQYT